jgi:hypothetical protein
VRDGQLFRGTALTILFCFINNRYKQQKQHGAAWRDNAASLLKQDNGSLFFRDYLTTMNQLETIFSDE